MANFSSQGRPELTVKASVNLCTAGKSHEAASRCEAGPWCECKTLQGASAITRHPDLASEGSPSVSYRRKEQDQLTQRRRWIVTFAPSSDQDDSQCEKTVKQPLLSDTRRFEPEIFL